MGLSLPFTPAGCALAAATVVAGAPLFGASLRALRLRRSLSHLPERPLAEEPAGFGLIRGRVALESPLVGPLSGKACAGFLLEVRGAASAVMTTIEDRRAFRLVDGGTVARVPGAEGAAWSLGIARQRTIAPGDPISQNLSALLARSPEAAWLRRCGGTVTLVERSLLAGAECWVIGSARHARPFELPAELELARTGTDDAPFSAARERGREPQVWIEADGHLDYLRISDHAPVARELAIPAWKTLGVAIGPTLGLAGLLYLARAVDLMRVRRF